jgi:gamma-glutamylcyclotransferase (GGCT)/AIG2-like uncharacterized protein YtfP
MKNVAGSIKLLKLAAIGAVLLVGGCFGASQESAKKISLSAESAAISADTSKPQTRTEIAITPKTDNSDYSGRSETKLAGVNTDLANPALGKKRKKTFSERERVKEIGVELAQKGQNIRKIKICHDRKNAEWWFTCYEDLGDILDLKQYVWRIDQDQPEPFLVIKRISKDNLQSHLSATEPDRTCRVLDPSPKGWPSVLEAAFGSDEVDQKNSVASKRPAKSVDSDNTSVRTIYVQKSHSPTKPLARQKPRKQTASLPSTQGDEDESAITKVDDVSPPSAKPKRASKPDEGDALFSTKPVLPPRKKVEQPKPAKSSDHAKFVKASGGADALVGAGVSEPEKAPSDTYSDANVLKGKRTAGLAAPVDSLSEKFRAGEEKPDRSPASDVPTYNVFVYGTEMNHQELLKWLQSNNFDESLVLDATPAILEDFDYAWNYFSPSRGGGAVNLQPHKNSRVYGLLLEIEDSALAAFDRKEGHPNYYSRGANRIAVKRSDNGAMVYAWVYRAKPNRDGRRDVWPTREYKQKILEAAIFWQFPTEYIGKINDWPTNN